MANLFCSNAWLCHQSTLIMEEIETKTSVSKGTQNLKALLISLRFIILV